MKYFFDGKMHTVSGKVTKKFIYQKNGVYRNPHSTLSNTPKNAIKVYLRRKKNDEQYYDNKIKEYENKIKEIVIAKKKLLRQIKKIEKLIKKRKGRN